MTVWIRTNFISFHLHLCYNKLKLLVRKMNAFTYFYEAFLQKCRDGFAGLGYRGYPVGSRDAISSQICV